MRILKDDKYESILVAAREEFISKGFKEASMRYIANKSNVGLSNIYNYFRNKDELYLAVVKPARDEIFSYITQLHTEENVSINRSSTFGHQDDAIDHYIALVEKYKDELRLLLYRSAGSSMSDFRDEFTDHLTRISRDYMELERKHFPDMKLVSGFFIHVMSAWMVSVLGEIVAHNLNREKIREFFREFFRFEFAGWKELTGVLRGDRKCLPFLLNKMEHCSLLKLN